MQNKIEDYEIEEKKVIIFFDNGEEKEISKFAFYDWLDKHSRLYWVSESGLENEKSGVCNKYKYFDFFERENILTDLEDYLIFANEKQLLKAS